MIKNIIFDLGNVLVDFNPMKYLSQFGFDEETKEALNGVIYKGKYWNEYDRGTYSSDELADILSGENPELEEQIRLVVHKGWAKSLTRKEDTVEFLRELKQRGFSTYILSNLSEEAYNVTKNYDFTGLMDGAVYSYEINTCKPELGIYNTILQKYGLNPQETIFMDDSERNIEVARRLGIHGVVFNDLNVAKQEVNDIIEKSKQRLARDEEDMTI